MTPKQYEKIWQAFKEGIDRFTPVNINEPAADRLARIERLEGNYEAWFAYYFPHYYTCEPARFHKAASKRVIERPEWYEVRSWSRELAKTARTMMEVLNLTLRGKKRNVILVSSSYDNAERLLLPYKAELENNKRISQDYGTQPSLGQWESGEFATKQSVSFRALGAGQNPRGTRKEQYRPDVILIDDIDTDEECRNPDRIKQKVKWIEEALIPTRSISNPLLLIVCGNIIAKYCCVTEMAKKADKHEVINIRDKNGKSVWPQKNTEEQIDRVLSTISYNSAQKEYFNNPISEGDVFKEITYGTVPKLKDCEAVVVYSDPATSNKDRGSGSTKSVLVVGYKQLKYYLYWVRLDQCTNATFVDWLYEAENYLKAERVDTYRIYVENNALQDPFYEQVILPLIYQKANETGHALPITPDSRKKPDKFFRVEGTLEPLNRMGLLVFNQSEKTSPHMQRMAAQMLGVSINAKTIDGPDALEGACWLIKNNIVRKNTTYRVGKRITRKY